MNNANQVLDDFADKVLETPEGVALIAPWSGVAVNDKTQAAMAALIKLGQIGATRRPNGKLSLYAGRSNAGFWYARLLGGWTTYVLSMAFLASIWWLHGIGAVWSDWLGLIWSFLGGGYFVFHGLHQWQHASLWMVALARPGEATRLGACVFAGAVGWSAAAGFASRIWG